MKSRGILMTTVMVEALLRGTKTQTRRGAGLKKVNKSPSKYKFKHLFQLDGIWYACFTSPDSSEIIEEVKFPYGTIGDGLWVRETFSFRKRQEDWLDGEYLYKTDFFEKGLEDFKKKGNKWQPSLFMPRAASRFDLEIVDISCERLQDISEEDAIAEGVDFVEYPKAEFYNYLLADYTFCSPIESYRSLIDLIHGKDFWESNPWVWVVKFKDVTKK